MSDTDQLQELQRLVREYDDTTRAHDDARLALADGMLRATREGITKTAILAAIGHRFPWSTMERLIRVAARLEGVDKFLAQPESGTIKKRPPRGANNPGYHRRQAAAEAGIEVDTNE